MAKGAKTGGRVPGSINKATKDVRQAVALLAENNVSKLEQWLQDTADGDPESGIKPDPAKAAALLLQAMEYHIPKLARTEHTGMNGAAIDHSLTVTFVSV